MYECVSERDREIILLAITISSAVVSSTAVPFERAVRERKILAKIE